MSDGREEQLRNAIELLTKLRTEGLPANYVLHIPDAVSNSVELLESDKPYIVLWPRLRWIFDPLNPIKLAKTILWPFANAAYLYYQWCRHLISARYALSTYSLQGLGLTSSHLHLGHPGTHLSVPVTDIARIGMFRNGVLVTTTDRRSFVVRCADRYRVFVVLSHLASQAMIKPRMTASSDADLRALVDPAIASGPVQSVIEVGREREWRPLPAAKRMVGLVLVLVALFALGLPQTVVALIRMATGN